MSNLAIERHTLYVCYFGLRQPLVQTQVIPYLEEIAKGGIRVSLLTFEPDFSTWTKQDREDAIEDLAARGIELHQLAYHKHPSALATAWDIFVGARFICGQLRDSKIDVLHGRVHVATLMAALARRLSNRKPKIIFDIRGFFPEEYTDAGVWPENGMLFRAAKRVERWLMRESDGFVVLTQRAREILFAESSDHNSGDPLAEYTEKNGRPVEVIPCCVDFRMRFSGDLDTQADEIGRRLGLSGRRVFVHVGALGGLYLTKEIVDLLAAARSRDPSVFALFLTQSDPAEVVRLLSQNGFSDADFFVGRVDSAHVPAYLAASNVGLSFVKATYATQSRSPTKIPEYLAAGLPVIANSGVGDVDELVNDEGIGVLVREFDELAYEDAIRKIEALADISERCRKAAVGRFDLETVGAVKYRRLYARLFCKD